ncbi:MAG: hypothetical protein Kow00127_09000 [Bacteroidales bacterium]
MISALWLRAGAQDKFTLDGHLQHMGTLWIEEWNGPWRSTGSIYNRLNMNWYPGEKLTATLSMRNMVNYGQLIYLFYPYYTDLLVADDGFLDLTRDWASDSSYVLYSNIDRAYLKYTTGKWEITAGRQRINWGINTVWNPNDIFNTFNYYDFDYVERPGCDALRVTWYRSYAGSLELAAKLNKDKEVTAAAMYRFNRWNYDLQLLAGVMETDAVVGAGWSGYIGDAGFTGEASWFRDLDHFSDTTAIWVASAGFNYTFKNSLTLNLAGLYNSNGTTGKAGWGTSFIILQELSPKTFTLARYSLMGSLSYPITPLIRGDLATIVNPNDGSFYLGPSFDISLADNISLLLTGQMFSGTTGSEFGGYGQMLYMRLKWSF